MQPSLSHYCDACTYSTAIPISPSVFSEVTYCTHCGSESLGINIRDRQPEKMSTQHEELVNLFARNLNFSNPTPPPEEPVHNVHIEQRYTTTPKVYASQHYTPTRHIVPVQLAQRELSPPLVERHVEPVQQQTSDEELVAMLHRNSIDPTLLFPSQVTLFRNADPEQRLRLLELWRISPPNAGSTNIPAEQSAWSETSLQREEILAKMRYEALMEERKMASPMQSSFTAQQDTGMMGGMHVGSPPPRPASAPEQRQEAEPYIMTGYEMLAQREYEASAQESYDRYAATPQAYAPLQESTRFNAQGSMYSQATDPAWQKVDMWQDMENQYGGHQGLARNGVDDEMIM